MQFAIELPKWSNPYNHVGRMNQSGIKEKKCRENMALKPPVHAWPHPESAVKLSSPLQFDPTAIFFSFLGQADEVVSYVPIWGNVSQVWQLNDWQNESERILPKPELMGGKVVGYSPL